MEKEYQIEIREELSRTEIVKADSLSEAVDMVMEKYYGEDIVLDASDFVGVDFMVINEVQVKEKARWLNKYSYFVF